jgi:hypothetical protein
MDQAFAANGRIDRARDIFNSLSDPPVGVAAQGNHPNGRRHIKRRGPAMLMPIAGPIYREPSTYESMIRAEAEHGEPEAAARVFEQALRRAFPPPVTERMRLALSTPAKTKPAVEPAPESQQALAV